MKQVKIKANDISYIFPYNKENFNKLSSVIKDGYEMLEDIKTKFNIIIKSDEKHQMYIVKYLIELVYRIFKAHVKKYIYLQYAIIFKTKHMLKLCFNFGFADSEIKKSFLSRAAEEIKSFLNYFLMLQL